MAVEAEVVDDRLKEGVDAAQKELQEQAAAYIDFVLRDRLIDKVTKRLGGHGMAAQMAQAAVEVFMEEIKHLSLELPGIRSTLIETAPPSLVIEAPDAQPLLLPAPKKTVRRKPKIVR